MKLYNISRNNVKVNGEPSGKSVMKYRCTVSTPTTGAETIPYFYLKHYQVLNCLGTCYIQMIWL